MHRQGQIAIEFFTLLTFSMLILGVLYGVVAQKQQEAVRLENQEFASKIADDVAFQAEMALVQGKGYSRTFNLPRNIAGESYNVTIVNSTVRVGYGKSSFVTSPTLYQGRRIDFSSSNQDRFKIQNNATGVYIS